MFDALVREREREKERAGRQAGRQADRETVRFSSDCHCNDWSSETYFTHPLNSAQPLGLLVIVTPP